MKYGLYSVHFGLLAPRDEEPASGVIIAGDGATPGGPPKHQFSRDIAPADG
jgi:hypothetical protein